MTKTNFAKYYALVNCWPSAILSRMRTLPGVKGKEKGCIRENILLYGKPGEFKQLTKTEGK